MKVKNLIEAKRALCKLVSQDVPVYWALRIAALVDEADPLFTDPPEREVEITPIVLPSRLDIVLSAADVKALSQIVRFYGGDEVVCDS